MTHLTLTHMISNLDLNAIRISANGRNVRYQGKALDKLDIAYLIKGVAMAAGHSGYTLWSDIYWYSSSKTELVDYLRYWLSKLD